MLVAWYDGANKHEGGSKMDSSTVIGFGIALGLALVAAGIIHAQIDNYIWRQRQR